MSSRDAPAVFTVGEYVSKREVSDDYKRGLVLDILKRTNMTRRQLESEAKLKDHLRYFSNKGTIPFREMNYWLRGKQTETSEKVAELLYEWAKHQQQLGDQSVVASTQVSTPTRDSAEPLCIPEKSPSTTKTAQLLTLLADKFQPKRARTMVVEEEDNIENSLQSVPGEENYIPDTPEDLQVSEIYIPDSQVSLSLHHQTDSQQSTTRFDEHLGDLVAEENLCFESQ